MFKSNGGFTLVELIVVIAILGILAGIAIPAYNGYITKAQDTKVIVELDAVATAAQAANATKGAVTSIKVGTDKSITVEPALDTAGKADFKIFYGSETFKGDLANTSYKNGATWTPANGWKAD